MYNLQFKNGLLYAEACLAQGDKSVKIKDVIIDTGSSNTIILTDFLYDLNIGLNAEDELVVMSGIGGAEASAVRKKIDSISIGDISLSDVSIDFGVIDPKD